MIYKFETPEHQRTDIQSVVDVFLCSSFSAPLVFLWPPSGAVKNIAGSRHTPACCLSMPRNRQEAGWCMGRVCQDYASTEDSIHICGEHYLNVLFT